MAAALASRTGDEQRAVIHTCGLKVKGVQKFVRNYQQNMETVFGCNETCTDILTCTEAAPLKGTLQSS
jgi:hypothetical protein